MLSIDWLCFSSSYSSGEPGATRFKTACAEAAGFPSKDASNIDESSSMDSIASMLNKFELLLASYYCIPLLLLWITSYPPSYWLFWGGLAYTCLYCIILNTFILLFDLLSGPSIVAPIRLLPLNCPSHDHHRLHILLLHSESSPKWLLRSLLEKDIVRHCYRLGWLVDCRRLWDWGKGS